MKRPLSIALTADPETPVPPVHYGGIEQNVDMPKSLIQNSFN
jgi:hypothetical protein